MNIFTKKSNNTTQCNENPHHNLCIRFGPSSVHIIHIRIFPRNSLTLRLGAAGIQTFTYLRDLRPLLLSAVHTYYIYTARKKGYHPFRFPRPSLLRTPHKKTSGKIATRSAPFKSHMADALAPLMTVNISMVPHQRTPECEM